MINLINRIQNNFNNASKSYDTVASVQQKAANFLVDKLLEIENFNPKTILDLGTGTGYIPELLIPIYPQSSYVLNDIASEMLEVCKLKFSRYPNVTYMQGDMIKLRISTFDMVISNLALQWVDNLWTTLKLFNTKSSAVFAFSTLLDSTFEEWKIVINQYQNIKLQNYPMMEELIDYCNTIKDNHTFDYWIMDIPISFDNPLKFMHYLRLLGASKSDNQMHFRALKALLSEYKGPITVSYKIFFGIFNKVYSMQMKS